MAGWRWGVLRGWVLLCLCGLGGWCLVWVVGFFVWFVGFLWVVVVGFGVVCGWCWCLGCGFG
ncbi:hypothetical protein RA276_27790, partial [Pseudomonas syringae pv. tagetis]|uniref:hypothetical protein n=1 Tax=Pseudomonas syringae group genomosp. 7 TaxID=251699 RepID=UPI00376FAF2A